MKEDELPYHRKMCPAMKNAGIKDPESLEGKKFCTDKCPYDRCMVFEAEKSPYTVRRNYRAERAKRMAADGLSVEEIAIILGKKKNTIRRYLM